MAGATILLRDSENRAVLSNSIATRLVGIGTSWNKIRAGILFQIDGTTSISNPVGFALGFSAGTAAVYGDATTTHFVGAIVDSGWTFSSSWYQSAVFKPGKRVGTTTSLGTALASDIIARGNPGALIVRSMLFIDIEKGSPNYSFQLFGRNVLNTATPPTEANFLTQMEAATPSFIYHAYSAAQTLAVDEGTDGVLDAFNLYWMPSTQPNEVSMAAVTVLS